MVKALLWLLLLVLSGHAVAKPYFFSVSPTVCVTGADEPCALELNIRWSQAEEVCLYRLDTEELLVCGHDVRQQLTLHIHGNLPLQLRSAATAAVLQQKVIRYLQQVEDSDTLSPRRLSWSLF